MRMAGSPVRELMHRRYVGASSRCRSTYDGVLVPDVCCTPRLANKLLCPRTANTTHLTKTRLSYPIVVYF